MNDFVYETKYLKIKQLELEKNKKTYTYLVYSNDILGTIKWYAPWRKYCFYTIDNTIFDSKCLTELCDILDKINLEYKNNRKENING